MEIDFKQKIKAICEHHKITLVDFCKSVGLSRTYMYQLQAGKKKVNKELLEGLEDNLRINKDWFLGTSKTMTLPPRLFTEDIKNQTPLLWEDLKAQYEARIKDNEKRIIELEFIANLFKAEKIADPRYANFLQPNTEKGRVMPHPSMGAGATCGLVANF